ncbi:iron reductase domain protein [Xylona heveae TC161]|uniref:Iron reductase domain protein n=1 Tax=Xylona heveae (strain CBS 132557 / TC161) TaxID=1328760 RepID=A0A165I5T8_XYLHT|nr:iron reductase domain protein [Xylona heveae TC161]KZF24428.1 iron reductase domain protein [Xylona heveae TC161]
MVLPIQLRRVIHATLGGLVLFQSIVDAASSSQPASSSFSVKDGSGQLSFAINVPDDSNDIFFHMSAPSDSQWAAVGAGGGMTGALMFVIYPAKSDSSNVTLSPRIGRGHFMPTFAPSIDIEVLDGTSISDDVWTVNAKCSNCRNWNGGSLDVTSKTQPWIYAVGPSGSMASDSQEANIQQHQFFGHFTLDMVAATGKSGVPGGGTSSASPSSSTSTSPSKTSKTSTASPTSGGKGSHSGDDNNSGNYSSGPITSPPHWGIVAHAVLMSLAFVIFFPFGILCLRAFGKVRLHWIAQAFSTMVLIAGFGLGIYISKKGSMFNKFNAPHQIIGLIVFGCCILQIPFGTVHHMIFKRTRKSTAMGLLHRWNGRIFLTLGFINGIVGLNWAGDNRQIIPYAVVGGVLAIMLAAAIIFTERRNKRKGNYQAQRQSSVSHERHGSSDDNVRLTDLGDHSSPERKIRV